MTPKQFEKWFHRPAKITFYDGQVLEGYPVPNDWKKYLTPKTAKILLVPFNVYKMPDKWFSTCQWCFCANSVKKVEEAEFKDMSMGKTDLLWGG